MKRLTFALLLLLAAPLFAADKYVSPSGSGGTCSLASPGKFADAISSNSCGLQPGDTLWVRGGTYVGTFTSWLNGSASNRIIIRNYNGERAQLDGGQSSSENSVLLLSGSYVWVWGLEVMSSNTDRICTTIDAPYCNKIGSNPDLAYGQGIAIDQSGGVPHPGLKAINCIVHDTRQGLSLWVVAADFEAYGNILYYNGWVARVSGPGSDSQHGHGLYWQNPPGSLIKLAKHNLSFSNFDHGGQMYGSSTSVMSNTWTIENFFSRNGCIVGGNCQRNLLIGGDQVNSNNTITGNLAYYTRAETTGSGWRMGYGAGHNNVSYTNNKVYTSALRSGSSETNLTMNGNVFAYQISGFSCNQYGSNTCLTSDPTVTEMYVYPNQYEPGRCNVWGFNWANAASYPVNLSTCGLTNGQSYEIRNAYNYYGGAVATGTYSTGSPTVSFPMNGLTYAAIVENDSNITTPTMAKERAFVVLPTTGGGPTPTKTATAGAPTSTPTRTATGVPPTATRTPTPSVPSPTPVPGQGVYFEAESGLVAAPMAMTSDPLASGGTYVSSPTDGRTNPNSGWDTFTVQAITPGAPHWLWHRVLCSTSDNDSFFVGLDAENDSIHIDDACEGATGSAWQWRRVTDRNLGLGVSWKRTLSAGPHTLIFRGREADTKLDRIVLTTDANFVPTDGQPPSPTPTPSPSPTRTPTVTPSNPPPTVCVTATPTP